jgi:very-short-patch-repair endonuclease
MMTDSPKKPDWQVTRTMRARARSLRRDSTDAERIIWNALRAHRPHGASFHRQTSIDPYIADFVCRSASLIVEIDGGQHFEEVGLKRDLRRDAFLNAIGYRVIRFNNYDVMANRVGVLEAIAAAIEHSPSPPSPASGGASARPSVRKTR